MLYILNYHKLKTKNIDKHRRKKRNAKQCHCESVRMSVYLLSVFACRSFGQLLSVSLDWLRKATTIVSKTVRTFGRVSTISHTWGGRLDFS